MSAAAKPILTGQRLKSRKRDATEKFDSKAFRDELVAGLCENSDFESASKHLEENKAKFDYRQYDEALFDVIIAGGLLAPGGSIVADGAEINPFSIFSAENNFDSVSAATEVVRKLVQRYKYLQVSLEEAFEKLLKFLNGFEEENTLKLAQCTALLLGWGMISAKPLASMNIESVVSSGLARKFITQMFATWLKVSSIGQMHTSLRKAGLDQQMHIFFPQNERSVDDVTSHFSSVGGLDEVVTWYLGQQTAEVKQEMGALITRMTTEEKTQDEIIAALREMQEDNDIPESEVLKLMWPALLNAMEWNKKTELMMEQAMDHVHNNLKMLASWSRSEKAQIVLMVTMQEHAFINQNFLKLYKRICLLFYKAEVLSEDAVLRWYRKDHSTKGSNAFLGEMKPFCDWLVRADVEDA